MPVRGIVQHGTHRGREVGGEGLPRARVGRDHRLAVATLDALDGRLAQPDVAQQAPGEHEGVAGPHHGDEALLDFAQRGAAAALACEPHLQ